MANDPWAKLEAQLAERYQACNDSAATPSSILLAVLNAVAAARHPDPDAGGLPARDQEKPATEQGLFQKYRVERVDGRQAAHPDCDYFVLDVTHDAAARPALAAYATAVAGTHPQLAADMRARYGLQDDAEAAADAERYAWCAPMLDGSDDGIADQRAAALASALGAGMTGRAAIDWARERAP